MSECSGVEGCETMDECKPEHAEVKTGTDAAGEQGFKGSLGTDIKALGAIIVFNGLGANDEDRQQAEGKEPSTLNPALIRDEIRRQSMNENEPREIPLTMMPVMIWCTGVGSWSP